MISAGVVGSQTNLLLTLELIILVGSGWKGARPGIVGSQDSYQDFRGGSLSEPPLFIFIHDYENHFYHYTDISM